MDDLTLYDLQEIRKKADEHFKEVIDEFLSKPFIDCRNSDHGHGKTNTMVLAMLTTIIKMRTDKIRDELIIIRTLLDESPIKGKQKLTNLLKELK